MPRRCRPPGRRSGPPPIRWLGIPLALLAALAQSRPLQAWAPLGHAMIVAAAVEALPPALRPFYARHRAFIEEHSVDPDRWRDPSRAEPRAPLCAAERGMPVLEGDEGPRHYLDADAIDAYPFRAVPREFSAYRRLAGDRLRGWGTAPWAIVAYTELLARAMERGELSAILCRSAILAHYVADLAQPFHQTANHNGQLSGLEGIHFRVEADLVAHDPVAVRSLLDRMVAPGELLEDPREAAFEMLVEGYPAVYQLLRADLLAQRRAPLSPGQRGADNPAYMGAFWELASDVVAERMADAAHMVASYWTTAWHRAGRPALGAPGS